MLTDVLIGGVSSNKLFERYQHLSLKVVQQRMVVTSAAFEATLDILVPSTILCRMIWSKTMVAISGVSGCIKSLVCHHRFEVITEKQSMFGFTDWTRREFGWFLVQF
jgi:hypothetical protein